MGMEMNQSHYDVLGVSEDASQREIRQAYNERVEEHPPTDDPETYERLRRAYDTLSDPESRQTYDEDDSVDGEAGSLRDEAEALLQGEDPAVTAAIEKLEQAVELRPDAEQIHNRLWMACLMDTRFEESLDHCEKAIELSTENEAQHRVCRGTTLTVMGRKEEAEEAFRRALEDERVAHNAAQELVKLLRRQERFEEAHEVLNRAIWADDTFDFDDFSSYLTKLELYTVQGELEGLGEDLEMVTEIADTPEDRQYAAYRLAELSDQCYDLHAYEASHRFATAAQTLDDGSLEIEKAMDDLVRKRKLEEAFHDVGTSDEYPEVVQEMVVLFYNQAIGELWGRQAENAEEELSETVEYLLQADPSYTEIMSSLRRLKDEYPTFFELEAEYFEGLLDTPEPDLYEDDCPHCGESVRSEKDARQKRICSSCSQDVYADGTALYTSDEVATDEYEAVFSDGSGMPGRCFVATAVYGRVEHPDVRRLRRFRDDTLRRTWLGRRMIAWYYRYGPTIARELEGHRAVKRVVRQGLAWGVDWFLRSR